MVYINGIKCRNVRIGLVKKLKMEGVECILNSTIIGEIC